LGKKSKRRETGGSEVHTKGPAYRLFPRKKHKSGERKCRVELRGNRTQEDTRRRGSGMDAEKADKMFCTGSRGWSDSERRRTFRGEWSAFEEGRSNGEPGGCRAVEKVTRAGRGGCQREEIRWGGASLSKGCAVEAGEPSFCCAMRGRIRNVGKGRRLRNRGGPGELLSGATRRLGGGVTDGARLAFRGGGTAARSGGGAHRGGGWTEKGGTAELIAFFYQIKLHAVVKSLREEF